MNYKFITILLVVFLIGCGDKSRSSGDVVGVWKNEKSGFMIELDDSNWITLRNKKYRYSTRTDIYPHQIIYYIDKDDGTVKENRAIFKIHEGKLIIKSRSFIGVSFFSKDFSGKVDIFKEI